jgi:hypothetical protein
MTTDQLRRMQAGRRAATRERHREAIRRVTAFERWLKRGSRLRDIPPIPTDDDYAVMRRYSE